MITLKGITWNHPRGYQSIKAVSDEYAKRNAEVSIVWEIRSLKKFGDDPVEKLAENYDLIMLDHPHIGSAVRANALLALDERIGAGFLADQEKNSVGKSCISYKKDGRQWALPIDAAAQVSAFREDLRKDTGRMIPKTWEEVLALAKELKGKRRVGIPLCQTDVYCSFLTLCVSGEGDNVFTDQGLDHDTAFESIRFLTELVPYIPDF